MTQLTPSLPELLTAWLPAQRWFLEMGSPEAHHFNLSFAVELREPVDPALLERAVAAVLDHHDALRNSFVREDDEWRQTGTEPGGAVPFRSVDRPIPRSEAISRRERPLVWASRTASARTSGVERVFGSGIGNLLPHRKSSPLSRSKPMPRARRGRA